VYRALGRKPPRTLDRHIVPRAVVWTFTSPVRRIQAGDRLTVRTNCPGVLAWRGGRGEPQSAELVPAGGVMGGVQRYHLTLGPFPPDARELRFRFRCSHAGCTGDDICCSPQEHAVEIV